MKKITPNIDLQNSIQRDRILESRDFYKGKSFRYSEWRQGHTYYNDEWYTDFVSYEGVLLACQATHPAVEAPEILRDSNNNPYGVKSSVWSFVMAGTPGPKGQVYVPNYNAETGELTWELSNTADEIKPVNIKGKDAIQPEFKVETNTKTGLSHLIQYIGSERTDLGEIRASAIRFARTLPPNPEDYRGQILILETSNGTDYNEYLEYIAVKHGDGEDYAWELVGGDAINNEDLNEIKQSLNNVIKIDNVLETSDIEIKKDKDGNMSLKLKEDIKPV